MTDNNSALAEISKAQLALENAAHLHEILELRDMAAAYQLFANAQGFREAAQQAKIFQLQAERKAGKWLEENVKHEGNRFGTDFQDERPLPEGIDWNESHRWQLEAQVPQAMFDTWVDECLATGKEISAAGLQRMGRMFKTSHDLQEIELPHGKYRVIYADPPWQYGDQLVDGYGAAEHHYPSMSLEQLCMLPIREMVNDDAVLFLWVTSPLLEDSFRLVRAWEFEYKASFVWDKVKHNYGHYNSVRHELLLVCTRGSCLPDTTKLVDSVLSVERTGHSRKPEEFRAIIDQLYTDGKRLELFAREKAEGWEAWGNELG